MDIFQLADKKQPSSAETCLFDDEIFLPEDTFYKPSGFTLDIDTLKRAFGNNLILRVPHAGKIIFRAGVLEEGKSFVWLVDKRLFSGVPEVAEIAISLENFANGKLELEIFAADDSILYAACPVAGKMAVSPEKKLYSFLFPTYELCNELLLYCRFSSQLAWFSFEDGHVRMKKSSSADLLTYFNAFSAGKWQKYTNVTDLDIYLDFQGKALVDVVLLGSKGKVNLRSWRLEANERATLGMPLGKYPDYGLLGLRITALDECEIFGGGYLTDSPETQNVRLGIGITTFMREDAVRASVSRLVRAIDSEPYYRDKIAVTVVDNGRTLAKDDFSGAKLIPNRNLGGSGGFMRNLIHYQDDGSYTHCLFMDDDAACEPGSVFRSMSFLRHALDDKSAISGAMLSENIKFIQWENGAWFDSSCHPLKCNYDLRKESMLLKNENDNYKKAIYGAWWFFMFPIKWVKKYSFPFFVRGDDVEFSYLNEFKVITLNGVCSWQEDFKTKESPQTLYFDIRSHLMHHLMIPELEKGKFDTIKMIWTFFRKHNDSYQYDTAKSIVRAFDAALDGPEYWVKNMDTQNIRNEVKGLMTYERRKPLNPNYSKIPYADAPDSKKAFNRLCRKLSLNGHLFPAFMLDGKKVHVSINDMPQTERVYKRKKILVCNPNAKQQWLIGRNTSYYFTNLARFGMAALKFLCRYNGLKRDYQKFFAGLETNKFWKDEFGKNVENNK